MCSEINKYASERMIAETVCKKYFVLIIWQIKCCNATLGKKDTLRQKRKTLIFTKAWPAKPSWVCNSIHLKCCRWPLSVLSGTMFFCLWKVTGISSVFCTSTTWQLTAGHFLTCVVVSVSLLLKSWRVLLFYLRGVCWKSAGRIIMVVALSE